MKRTLAFILSALMLLCCLTGCNILKPKTLTFQDLSITVPAMMRDATGKNEAFSQYTFALDSMKIAIFGLHEDATLFEADLSLEEYAQMVITANELTATPVSRIGYDYYYFSFDKTLETGNYRYLAATYKGENGFWLVQVASLVENYDEASFFEYLDSVIIG